MNKRTLIPCATAILTVAATLIGPAASAASDQGVATPPPTVTFTTCGQTGRFGPSQAQCDSAYSGQPQAEPDSGFRVEAGIQYWTVPATGSYLITVAGAAQETDYQGGRGAKFTTQMRLEAGEVLKVLVGQQSPCVRDEYRGCGGAGGTFVATSEDAPLAVAGGGGGKGRGDTVEAWSDASFNQDSGCPRHPGGWCEGGSKGIGQGGTAWWCGTGGGGFYGNGDSSCWDPFRGGRSFVNGGAGGWSQCGVMDGGFGGGGAGFGCWEEAGGGGGGYTGGSGVDNGSDYCRWRRCWYEGRSPGGGGSYTVGDMADRSFNRGNGWVQIAPTISTPGLSVMSLQSTAGDSVSATWDWARAVKISDWDTKPDSYAVQYSLDNGSTWSEDRTAFSSNISFSGLPCAGTVQVRVAAVWSYGTSDWTVSDPVVVGSDKFRYCPNTPSASAPGQPVAVTIVGANPAAKFVSLAVSGATHTIDVGADTIARLTVSPIAAGKTKVSATQVFLDPNTRRWTKQRIDTAVWTFGLKVPRSATVGKPATVTVAYLTPGLSLRITGGDSDAVLTANASGSARGSLMFSRPGIYTVSATGPDGSTIVSGTVNVARGR